MIMKRIIYKSSEVSPLNILIKGIIQSWKELKAEWKECRKFLSYAVKILYGENVTKECINTIKSNIKESIKVIKN